MSTMSIDRETFENANKDEFEELSARDQMLGSLAANEERAFRDVKSFHRLVSMRAQ